MSLLGAPTGGAHAARPTPSLASRQGRRRTIPNGRRGGWRALALALSLALPLAAGGAWPTPARAATIFTPSIKAGLGYDDNVRQTQNPHGDTFATVTPGATLETGTPGNDLMLSAQGQFNQYHRLSQYNGFESGDVLARWRYSPSPVWNFELGNSFTSSYDQAELNENGQLNQIRTDNGRRDRNTTGLRVVHLLGPGSQMTAGYSYSFTHNQSSLAEDQVSQQADLGLNYRFSPLYRVDISLYGALDDYERSDDIERGNLDLRLVRMFGPNDEVWAGVMGGVTRSLSENAALATARNYDTYTGRLGFKKAFTPQWLMEGWGGFTYITGEESANSAAGEASPTGNLQLSYRQPRWTWRVYGSASMDEYSSLGQNTGLIDRKQVGTGVDYSFTPRWRLALGADYLHDDYKQNQALAGTQLTRQYDDYWLLSSVLSYQVSQNWSMRLDYRYMLLEADIDTDNREQNRLLLLMDYALPYRW